MGRKKKAGQDEQNTDEQKSQQNGELDEPERFDRALLLQRPAVRLDYFENHCRIEHIHLETACEAILQAICSPGEGPSLNRLAIMVNVIGPSRVGKTTLIELLEERLQQRAKERMLQDPSFIPFASIRAVGPSSRFDWQDYHDPVLRQLGDPFVDQKSANLRVRDKRKAMIEACIQRQPYAIIVDEAQHLAKATRGSSLQNQLDYLKDIENQTGVSHVLVGTYEMRPFRKASAQLAGRSIDVHFPRYDATKANDRQIFRSVLWALQCQMPVEEEPLLAQDHWEYLYARSIGCIGRLKMHLNAALNSALIEGAKTITQAHLRANEPGEDRVELWLNTALKGEADLTEREGADGRLLKLFGLGATQKPLKKDKSTSEGVETLADSPRSAGLKPGDRTPGRDPIGSDSDEEDEDLDNPDNEQAAG